MKLNKIYNESCLDTMSRMDDNFIDLTVTSPPYDNLRDYKGYTFPFEKIANELYRVTKNGGVVVWVVNDSTVNGSESGTSFRQALYFKDLGFNLHDTMIYAKNNYVPLTHNRYEQQFEYMFIFSKGKPNTFNPIKEKTNHPGNKSTGRYQHGTDGIRREANSKRRTPLKKVKPNIFFYSVGNAKGTMDKIAFNHPATFPEKLAKDQIYTWSNKGDIIYDSFTGSATTLKMAHLMKRKWIGSEISQEYVELAYKRLEPYLTQTTLF